MAFGALQSPQWAGEPSLITGSLVCSICNLTKQPFFIFLFFKCIKTQQFWEKKRTMWLHELWRLNINTSDRKLLTCINHASLEPKSVPRPAGTTHMQLPKPPLEKLLLLLLLANKAKSGKLSFMSWLTHHPIFLGTNHSILIYLQERGCSHLLQSVPVNSC